MNPSEPPAEPIVATIAISLVLILVEERKKNAKKKSAAIVGPSSITPKLSVRYEFTAQRSSERKNPAISARGVRPLGTASGAAGGLLLGVSGDVASAAVTS